jgi:formylmethanofuran dehydrogenase subunit E
MEKQMRRKTEEEARAEAIDNGFTPDADVPYPGGAKPWKGTCNTCDKSTSPRLANIISGKSACKYCAGNVRKTEEEARAEAIDNGFTPDADVPYPGGAKHWKGTCNTCDKTVSPTLENARTWRACKYCGYAARAKAQKVPEEEAREIATAKGKYTPDADVPYPGSGKPWKGTCNTCGETVSPRLSSIQKGASACVACGHVASAKARMRPEEEAREIATANGKYTPDADVPYPGLHTPWKGTCNTCDGTVSPRLGNIQAGKRACVACADHGGFDPTKPGWLYLMAGDSDGLPWLKVGITNNAPANRAKDVGGTIIDSVLYENGADAHRDEQEILGQLGDLRGTGIPEGGDGYTESWSAWLMTVTTLTELRERYAAAA